MKKKFLIVMVLAVGSAFFASPLFAVESAVETDLTEQDSDALDLTGVDDVTLGLTPEEMDDSEEALDEFTVTTDESGAKEVAAVVSDDAKAKVKVSSEAVNETQEEVEAMAVS